MLKIGLTGGIGSGKSTAAEIFGSLGVPIYNADLRARWLMNNDAALRQKIENHFGDQAYDADGNLNRPFLSSAVFNDPEKLKLLNSLVHPAVQLDYESWLSEHSQSAYTLKEAAILFESGSSKNLDAVIVVSAPEDLRIERVTKRDNSSKKDILARMANQMGEEERLKLADYVLVNDGIELLIPQILKIHRKIASNENS